MRSETDLYWKALRYRGRGGKRVELKFKQVSVRRFEWRFALAPNFWVGPFQTKLDALAAAAIVCQRSPKDMGWEPC